MKKHTVIFMVFTFSAFCEQSLFAQCNNGNTHDALDTYWHYRYRLIHYFMQVGEGTWDQNVGGFGQSIPAYIRNGGNPNGSDNGCTGYLSWSDQGRFLGYYIGTLASEYYLLYNNHQNTNETAMELFYALHAVFRLDSLGLQQWMPNTFNQEVIPSGNVTPVFPGQGYMMQDDVPSDFYNTVATAPIITDPASYAVYNGYGLIGSGLVGPVNTVSSSYSSLTGSTSQDNYYGVLMGLALTVKLMQSLPAVTSFYDANGNPVNFASQPHYSDLCTMAKELGQQILQYIFCCENYSILLSYYPYDLFTPDGSPIAGTTNLAYCQPINELASNIFGYTHNAPSCSSLNTSAWGLYTIQNLCHLSCPPEPANIEMACELSAMSNDGGPDGIGQQQACQFIESLGNYPVNPYGCTCPANNYGEDQLFMAVNLALYSGPPFQYLNFCEMQDIINSAPYEGPYHHEDCNQSSPDHASCGWASTNRFVWGPTYPTCGNGWAGNFNGLDYMLFYNLYCITSGIYNIPTYIPAHSCTDYPEIMALFYPNLDCQNDFIGTLANPVVVEAQYCTPIIVNELDIMGPSYSGGAGGCELHGAVNSYIDLKPSGYNNLGITVNYGGFFYAVCDTSCCIPSPAAYAFESDPDPTLTNGNDRSPQKRIDSSANKYHVTREFNLNTNYDAIVAEPSPFHTQTTFEFAVKETTPVTISIFDMKGQKIMDVMENQTYNQGEYAQPFSGSSLAAGIYLAVMTTKDDKKTIKIVKN